MKKSTLHLDMLIKTFLMVFVLAFTLNSCEDDIADVGDLEDLTPPSASFTFNQFSPDSYLEVTFSNTSVSATDYLWDFGDGNTSTEVEPVYTYAAEGTYTVTLTASDKLGVSSTAQMDITLTEPNAFIPPILESGFEDGALDGGTGDGRDSWRNSDLGGVIQITSSPVYDGSQAAKLPGGGSDIRIGYQLLTVTPNTTYEVSFYYTMKDDATGFLTVGILDGPATDHTTALNSMLGSVTVNDQSDPSTYVEASVLFNSGSNSEVAIYFFNDASVETRLDNFTINLSQSSVPPTAAFTAELDSLDPKKVTFTNTSQNATSYSWNFGDGNTSTDVSPIHTYAAEGNYTVTLTATNANGDVNMVTETVAAVAPITVAFTSAIDATDYKKVQFTNSSVNATNYSWDFGDGNSSTDTSPMHTYTTDGTYTVVLSAENNIGEVTTYSENIVIANPNTTAIQNGSFDLKAVRNDNRDEWRNTDLEADAQATLGIGNPVLQMSSTNRSAPNAGKLPTAENSGDPRRWIYQAIAVTPNTDYTIKGWIRNKAANVGSTVTFQIYDAPFTTAAVVNDATKIIATEVFNASTGHDTDAWTEATITFNSGSSSEVVLFITNDYTLTATDSESFFDDFSIQ